MVTSLRPGELTVFSPKHGPTTVRAKAIVLATGCRERTRGNLVIPGTRPSGVLTAGTAQRLVNLHGYLPGRRALILGSGDVGLIMARRLTLEGVEVARVVELMPYATGLPRNVAQCLHDFGIPLQLHSTVTRILGWPRLEAVEITDLASGRVELLSCDLLLLSVGLICENELVLSAGLELDPRTGGPYVDDRLALPVPGLFAAGNGLHVSDLVDRVTVEGELAGLQAARHAASGVQEPVRRIPIISDEGVRSVVPQYVCEQGPQEVVLAIRVQEPLRQARFELWSSGRVLARHTERACAPGQLVLWGLERRAFASADEPCRVRVLGEPLCAPESAHELREGEPQDLLCVICPLGCRLQVHAQGHELLVKGAGCPDGRRYARDEFVQPKRAFTTTIPTIWGRPLPVRSTGGVPKEKLLAIPPRLASLRILRPVKPGEILLPDMDGAGTALVASEGGP
jgi:CxxC motif-containing protein/thioredoxin reductase